jgi:hypothetical protein
MKTYKRGILSVTQRLSITVLAGLLFTVSARAQTRTIALSDVPGGDAAGVAHSTFQSNVSFVPNLRLTATNALIESVKSLVKQFDNAWRLSGAGSTGRESVVLIFRMSDGSFAGRGQGFTNQYKKFTFNLDRAAIAIVHTHPNSCNPKPSTEDQRVADHYHLPIFTITVTGMYVYEPTIKKTSKVLEGLAWLDSANGLPSLLRLFDLIDSQNNGH